MEILEVGACSYLFSFCHFCYILVAIRWVGLRSRQGVLLTELGPWIPALLASVDSKAVLEAKRRTGFECVQNSVYRDSDEMVFFDPS